MTGWKGSLSATPLTPNPSPPEAEGEGSKSGPAASPPLRFGEGAGGWGCELKILDRPTGPVRLLLMTLPGNS
jgi:hypothetical protein